MARRSEVAAIHPPYWRTRPRREKTAASAIQSVAVTLTNSIGTSAPVTALSS
jgi:hypothetical protein